MSPEPTLKEVKEMKELREKKQMQEKIKQENQSYFSQFVY
jgi:hypothetical protein